MQINNCYEKVKKNCFKFIKSQETRTNKFKNKNKMLKSYLIPLCFWINKKVKKKIIFNYWTSWWSGNWKNNCYVDYIHNIKKLF